MEVVTVVVVLLAVSTALMVKPGRSGSPRSRLRKTMGAAELPEESLRDRLQRRLKDKQEHHRSQLNQWDEAYYAQLPTAEHPDFLEPTTLISKANPA